MKLTVMLLFICCLQVSAKGFSQSVSLYVTDAPLEKVFEEIEKQTGFRFVYASDLTKKARKVTLRLKNVSIEEAVDQSLKNQPFTYAIINSVVIVNTKKENKAALDTGVDEFVPSPSIKITGRVTDEKGEPLESVTVSVKGTNKVTTTNNDGEFTIPDAKENAILVFSRISFETYEVKLKGRTELAIQLKVKVKEMDQVVLMSTGYQVVPKERATGSFETIGNKLFNRGSGTSVLERLYGMATGIDFNGTGTSSSSFNKLGLTIRGQSTLSNLVNRDPLIVVDNFPYEGDIRNLNPNDVESVVILKDAAAASIWGARAGNGVIVITTKKGGWNQKMKIELNANITVTRKPDLYYNKSFLPSSEYIDLEVFLFNQGLFNADLNSSSKPPLSPVIELLADRKAGQITQDELDEQLDKFRSIDVRKDFHKYIYQSRVLQQYALSMRGGSKNLSYSLGVGFDKNKEQLIRNGYDRLTINASNTFLPVKNLELAASILVTQSNRQFNNQMGFGNVLMQGSKYSNIYPYAQLTDASGNPLYTVRNYRATYLDSVEQLGFLDWRYRPLEEIGLADNNTQIQNSVMRLGLKYQFAPSVNIAIQYQSEKQSIVERDYHRQETYYTRDYINRYTQYDPATSQMSYPFPKGAILEIENDALKSQMLRGQMNFHQTFNHRHEIVALAGGELREASTSGNNNRYIGYDEEFGTFITNLDYTTSFPTHPSRSALIPSPEARISGTTRRFVSYFANAAYTYSNRYTISLSGRKDGANIFGVKTNDKITPLWSAGIGWAINKESFYRVNWLPYLKLRASYGYNGNVYNGSSYLTAQYATSAYTGAPIATITTAPNNRLRWEKIRNFNMGLDFSSKNNRINGVLEIYQKEGLDLIHDEPLAPSTGFLNFKANAARTRIKGIDFNLNSMILGGGFKWSSALLVSLIRDQVVKYEVQQTTNSIQTNSVALPGKAVTGVYSYHWAGLDPSNGDPMGFLKGKASKDYLGIINNFHPDSLKFHGSSRPRQFGALRNNFSYKGFTLSANISFAFSYYFRRPSVNTNYPGVLLNGAHSDYSKRWMVPGDEKTTSVPSLVYPTNNNRNLFYMYSEALVEKGDHVRLEDIRFSYELSNTTRPLLKNAELYLYVRNIGILWKANKAGLDPEIGMNRLSIPEPLSISMGFKTMF